MSLKTIFLTAFFAFNTICSLSIYAQQFIEGKHYQVIEGLSGSTKEVREYFSFFCPHCFKQEPLMAEIKKSLPPGTKFVKNHVDQMPGQNLNIEQALSKSLIMAKIFNVEDKVIPAIFKQIHVDKKKFSSVEEVKAIFVIHGVAEQDFDKAITSFSVDSAMRKMKKNTQLLRSKQVNSVPTLIVNGKYRPITRDIKSMSEYLDLIQFLLTK